MGTQSHIPSSVVQKTFFRSNTDLFIRRFIGLRIADGSLPFGERRKTIAELAITG